MSTSGTPSHGLIGPEAELRRLEMQEEIFDPFTRMVFGIIGVAEGWRCLEVGVGAGSVTNMLSGIVGASGHVLGSDLDGRFFDQVTAPNVQLVAGDVRKLALEPQAFDLVHTRMTLIYFANDVADVLRQLTDSLRPSGWLVCEEADMSVPHRHRGDGAAWDKYVADSRAAMKAVGADFAMGDQLVDLFHDAGLIDVRAEAHYPYWTPGSTAAAHAHESLEFARPFLTQHQGYTDADIDHLGEAVSSDTVRTGYALVSAWGRKP
jgi:SAM-dependent methyltransferase